MKMDKITISNLDLFYGDFQALKKINMRVPANEITALHALLGYRGKA